MIKKPGRPSLGLSGFSFLVLTLTVIIVDRPLVLSLGGEKNASQLQFMPLLRKIYQTLPSFLYGLGSVGYRELLENLLSLISFNLPPRALNSQENNPCTPCVPMFFFFYINAYEHSFSLRSKR